MLDVFKKIEIFYHSLKYLLLNSLSPSKKNPSKLKLFLEMLKALLFQTIVRNKTFNDTPLKKLLIVIFMFYKLEILKYI